MKVLFLDIDGVLCTHMSWFLHGHVWFESEGVSGKLDEFGVKFVEQLIKHDVKIVLSSTWRKGVSVEEWNEKFSFKIIDKTVSLWGGTVRGDEIKEWLDRHPDVEKYVIVDDDSDMLPEQMDNFVQTKYGSGLTFDVAKEICEKLDLSIWDLRLTKNKE